MSESELVGQVRGALASGSPDKRDRDGSALLHVAAKSGDAAALELLNGAGASLINADNQGRMPLHCATEAGQVDAARCLLTELEKTKGHARRMVEMPDARGLTPLHLALQPTAALASAEAPRALLELLVPCATPLGAAAFGATPARPSLVTAAASSGRAALLELLLGAGAAFDEPEPSLGGRRPLACAAAEGHHSAVEILVRHGADPNATDDDGTSAAHWAALMEHADVARWLLSPAAGGGGGADPHAVDCNGSTVFELLGDPAGDADGDAVQGGKTVEEGAGNRLAAYEDAVIAKGEPLDLSTLQALAVDACTSTSTSTSAASDAGAGTSREASTGTNHSAAAAPPLPPPTAHENTSITSENASSGDKTADQVSAPPPAPGMVSCGTDTCDFMEPEIGEEGSRAAQAAASSHGTFSAKELAMFAAHEKLEKEEEELLAAHKARTNVEITEALT